MDNLDLLVADCWMQGMDLDQTIVTLGMFADRRDYITTVFNQHEKAADAFFAMHPGIY